MRFDERGRLTPVDVVFVGVGLAVLAFLGEPLYDLITSSQMATGPLLLFRMLVPALVAMLIYTIYRRSLLGGA